MITYTPIFNRLVESSAWDLPDGVRIVWVTMLALQDPDHVVRYTAYGLGKRARKSEAEVMEALKVLSEADGARIEPQEYEGRRIERKEDGWLILNGKKYQDEMLRLNERVRKARWAREHRAKSKGPGAMEQLNEKAVREQEEPR